MNIAPKPPLARQGQQLASHGRYGDTQLVHMNPYEVQGLAAMSPTGQLTTNPETGQPEAFLPFLAPLLGSALGSAALGGTALGAAGAGALGSGLATWAATGDFEKGLIGGITGFGLGKVFGAAKDAGAMSRLSEGVAEGSQAMGVTGTIGGGAFNPLDAVGSGGELASSGFGQNLGDIGRGFTSGQGLQAIGNAAMSPSAILPMAVGQGTMAQVEAQEGMDKLRKETTARDNQYAQDFKDVLTDSLGMARGSNPNPYMGKYAKGGIVEMYNGGDLESRMAQREYEDSTDYAPINASFGYGLDADNRYFINPKSGTGAERQSFLRGDFKQDAPTDYRHGFEKEFQFFDFVEDRPIERYADLFGAGASDYLAGLLAGNTGDAPTTPTYKLDDVDERTLKTSNFSGIGPGAGQGGDVALAPLVPAGGTSGASGQAPTGGTAPAGGTVAPAGVSGFIPAGTVGTAAPPSTTPPSTTPPSTTPNMDIDAGILALEDLGIELDQDYSREEGEDVYDVMQEYGVGNDQVAEYFFNEMYKDDPEQSTKNIAGAAQIVADRYQAGEDFGLGRRFGGEGSFEQADVDRVYANLTGDEPVNFATAADYFNVSGDELQGTLDAITSRAAAAEVLGDIPATDGDAVYDAIESGQVTVTDVANHYGFTYEEVRGAQDAITAQRAAAAAAAPAVAAPVIPTAGTIDRQDLMYGDDSIFAGMSPNELRQAGIYPNASGGRVGRKRFNTPLGMVEMANGGIAELPANLPMTAEVPEEMVMMESETVVENPMADTDFPQLVEMTVEAIKGTIENSDEVINQFIEEYGVEEFRNLREAVLQSIVPEAQTEGMIAGESGGMDDEVMGMIGEDQQVAVSPGEYIVAADVVSGLGDGNSDAGAVVLDDMMQGVRNARSGGQQPKPLNKAAVMPS